MKNRSWLSSWSRLLLWSHVVGVISFYVFLWLRTSPDDKVKKTTRIPKSAPDSDGKPFVSIIVPARNEERNIRRCVTSLLEQDYGNYEVIVVDDDSTDGTEHVLDEIAQFHPQQNRLYILRLRELPEGWAGKPHALHAGVQGARGDWLLFTDSDTCHAPSALRTAVTWATEADIDLLSLFAQQELPGFWEKVVMPMAYLGISMQYPVKKVNDPHSQVAIANGQYILLRRAVYDLTGGYARPDLRGTLLDDRDLARVVKACGYRLHLADGRELVRTRMYQGLGEIWRGWRKNAFLGSRGGLSFMLLQLIGLPLISVVPFLLPLLGSPLRTRRTGGIRPAEVRAATTLELLPLLTYRIWLNNQLRVPWHYALLHPVAGLLFEGILAQSSWRVLSGRGVDWRGRQYYHQVAPTRKPL